MSLGFFSNTTYRILQIAFILTPMLFTARCIKKFFLVRNEKRNPLKSLKLLFWSFAIGANGSSIFNHLVGITSEVAEVSKFRIVAEIFTAIPNFLFLCVLITTTILTENIVLIVINKKWKGIDWNNVFRFLSIAVLSFLLRLTFVAFVFFTNVILGTKAYTMHGETIYFYMKAFYYHISYHPIFRIILALVGILEGISFILIIYRLINVLRVIYSLMKRTSINDKIKDQKLKEWGIFIFLCCLVASIIVMVFVIFLIEDYLGLDNVQKLIDNDPTKEENQMRANCREQLFFFRNYDIFNLLTRIVIGIASAFIAPCREVMEGQRSSK